MTRVRHHLVFAALCAVAPSALLSFALLAPFNKTAEILCSSVGLLAAATIFIWSLASFRHHPVRAIIGLIVCVIFFLLLLMIPGYVQRKRHGLAIAAPMTVHLARVEFPVSLLFFF